MLALALPATWATAAVTVTDATQYQIIDGFGAASVWGAGKITSALAVKFWKDDSTLAPASQVNGNCGLSIERMLIDPAGNFSTEASGATKAIAQNPDIRVFASAWSPPVAYKKNGKTTGNSAGNTNFNPGSNTNVFVSSAANYQGYANFLVNFAKTMKTTYGVNLYAISPQNEPDYDVSYDSCLWTPQQFHDLIGGYLGPAMKSSGLSTQIMMPESFADNLAGAATTMADTAVAPYVGIIGMHLYGGGPTALPASYAANAGHDVASWVTEMSDFANNDPSMTNGMVYAKQIHTCIADRGFNAYVFWWLINLNSDNEGLCDNNSNPTKKLYVMGNFSKFVRPGFRRISATENPATGVQVSAYANTATAKVVIVAINSGSSASSQTFTLGGSLNCATVYPWITDSSRDLVQQSSVAISGGSFTYSLPANSVTTFVGSLQGGATPSASPTSSRTASPTFSRTITASATPSITATVTPVPPTATRTITATSTPVPSTSTSSATPSMSVTASGTATPLPSATDTPTPRPSVTSTQTGMPSGTSSATPIPSGTATATARDSATQTPEDTHTVTPGSTATHTPTAPATFTPADTASSTPVNSATITPANTATSTAANSATPTSVNTATSTPVSTATSTPRATSTHTPVNTATSTPRATSTSTPVNTASFTAVSSATPIPRPTSTQTPANTRTATSTPQPIRPTATLTPTAASPDKLKILNAIPVPNPNPRTFSVNLSGPADRLRIRIYSVAMNLVMEGNSGPHAAGWNSVPMPAGFNTWGPSGTYYVRFEAYRNADSASYGNVTIVIAR